MVADEVEGQLVEEFRRDAGLHVVGQHVEAFGRQAAHAAHGLEGLRPVKRDLRGPLALDDVGFGHSRSLI